MTIEAIAKELQEEGLTPSRSSELRTWLAGQYYFVSAELEGILGQKPPLWNQMRKDLKSDTATERAWEETEWGLLEMKCRSQLKAMDKMMSALSSRIRVAEGEARNTF